MSADKKLARRAPQSRLPTADSKGPSGASARAPWTPPPRSRSPDLRKVGSFRKKGPEDTVRFQLQLEPRSATDVASVLPEDGVERLCLHTARLPTALRYLRAVEIGHERRQDGAGEPPAQDEGKLRRAPRPEPRARPKLEGTVETRAVALALRPPPAPGADEFFYTSVPCRGTDPTSPPRHIDQ